MGGFRNLKMLASIKNQIGKEEICRVMEKVGLDADEKKAVLITGYRLYIIAIYIFIVGTI